MKQLTAIGVPAVHVGCGTEYRDVAVGNFRFGRQITFWLDSHVNIFFLILCSVFMAPETAVSPPWRNLFSTPVFKENLAIVAVDESHCIPEWFGQK